MSSISIADECATFNVPAGRIEVIDRALQQALLDRIRLMGFDHAIGLDSPRHKFASEI
jgi:hypothetical protein